MSTSAGNGVTVAVEFDVSQCDSFKVPSCPTASVPAADLLSGNPVTFTFSGSGTVPSFGDHSGLPITWMLSESVTVQRVQADGSPFRSTA